MWRCLRDPMFSHFDTIPACDGRTDGRTGYRASIASRGKNCPRLRIEVRLNVLRLGLGKVWDVDWGWELRIGVCVRVRVRTED